jgi:hypothetical protein
LVVGNFPTRNANFAFRQSLSAIFALADCLRVIAQTPAPAAGLGAEGAQHIELAQHAIFA